MARKASSFNDWFQHWTHTNQFHHYTKELDLPTPSPIYTNLHHLLADIILICLSLCNEKNMSASPPCILDSPSESRSYILDVMNKKNMHRSPEMWKPFQRRLGKLLPWFNAIPASPKPQSLRSHIYPAFINTLKLKYPSISHASSSRGHKEKEICLPQLCSNLTPGQVQDIPETDFLSEQSGIAVDFHTLSRGDGMASVSSSDWSSLTFSTPFMIPTSKLPAESTSAIYAYGNVSQMSVSKPVSPPSPLLLSHGIAINSWSRSQEEFFFCFIPSWINAQLSSKITFDSWSTFFLNFIHKETSFHCRLWRKVGRD